MLQSKLFDLSVMDADEYAELFNTEVQHLLDMHAPMRTRRRRYSQHDNRNLSDEARQAKQLRRRRERRYRRTGLQSDKAPTHQPVMLHETAFSSHVRSDPNSIR